MRGKVDVLRRRVAGRGGESRRLTKAGEGLRCGSVVGERLESS